MDSFKWDNSFITGINTVDEQHHTLIDLVNHLGNLLADNQVDFQSLQKILDELIDYSNYHFQNEEQLMQDSGMDKQHVAHHKQIHLSFLNDIKISLTGLSPDNTAPAIELFDYLTHWLAYHILGDDQNMAKQIKAIQSGISPHEAYQQQEKETDSSTEPLLRALKDLFKLISQRNKDLIALNEVLEEKVAKRTEQLQEANKHLEIISLTDELTGLPNRRHAMQKLSFLWKECRKNEKPLSCLMIDSDHFKTVNDTYGHDAGDLVLKELSRTFIQTIRTDDISCRLGGDEFLILCPETDIYGALRVADLILHHVNALTVKTGDGFWNGSVSIGVATCTDDMTSFSELIKMADNSVYAAKDAGKNCVRASQALS